MYFELACVMELNSLGTLKTCIYNAIFIIILLTINEIQVEFNHPQIFVKKNPLWLMKIYIDFDICIPIFKETFMTLNTW